MSEKRLRTWPPVVTNITTTTRAIRTKTKAYSTICRGAKVDPSQAGGTLPTSCHLRRVARVRMDLCPLQPARRLTTCTSGPLR